MTTQIEMTNETQAPQSTLRRLLWVSPLAMMTATAANLGLYTAVGSVFPEVTAWSGAGAMQIVGATIVYLMMATIVFAIIARRSSRPARTYTIIATVTLVLSMALPVSAAFGTPPASAATVVTLCLMHVLSYAISVPMFIRLVLNESGN
jgi:hypothetical protein